MAQAVRKRKSFALMRSQAEAIRVFANGGTREQAADAAGTSTRTLRRWQRDPEFYAAFLRAGRDVCSQTFLMGSGKLQGMFLVLESVARSKDPGVTAGTRIRAAAFFIEALDKVKRMLTGEAVDDPKNGINDFVRDFQETIREMRESVPRSAMDPELVDAQVLASGS